MKKVKKDIDVQLKDNRAYQNQRKHSRHEIVSLIQDSDGFKVRYSRVLYISQGSISYQKQT